MRRCTSEMRPCGIQHDEIDLRAAAEGLDGGAAGVAGGGDHDGGAFAALKQHVVHQPGDQLHRQILEGERRTVEQLEHEQIGAELHQRRGRRMTEGAVGLLRHAREIGVGDAAADEGADHLDRRPRRKAGRQSRRSSRHRARARTSGT